MLHNFGIHTTEKSVTLYNTVDLENSSQEVWRYVNYLSTLKKNIVQAHYDLYLFITHYCNLVTKNAIHTNLQWVRKGIELLWNKDGFVWALHLDLVFPLASASCRISPLCLSQAMLPIHHTQPCKREEWYMIQHCFFANTKWITRFQWI